MILEEEARNRQVSVNALMASILKRFAEFDRFSDKFGYVTIAKETFQLLVQEMDDENVVRAGAKAGKTVPKEIAWFWFKELDISTFFSFLSNLTDYCGLLKYDMKFEGGMYRVALRHDLGIQWSKFLQWYIGEAIRAILHTTPTTDLSENLILLTFKPFDGQTQRTLS